MRKTFDADFNHIRGIKLVCLVRNQQYHCRAKCDQFP